MKYHPPRRSHIPLQDYELYKDVVNAGCRYHDMMLARLIELAGEDTTIMLVSDHGFHPDHNRPVSIPNEPSGPAIEHSPYGIVVMNGAGIKKDSSIFGASLLDITPTLLSIYDLPIAEDMDGKVLTQAFEESPEIKTIKSWENIKPEEGLTDGTHPKDLVIDEAEASAELQQLIELGYIEDPGENGTVAVEKTIDENNYNLARAYLDGSKFEEGIKILEQLHNKNPKIIRFAIRLINAYQKIGKLKDARKTVNHIRGIINRESPQLDILEGTILLAEERSRKALELFQKAEREGENIANINLRIAHAYLQLNKLEDAERALKKQLEQDSEEVTTYHTLGITYFRMMRYEEALGAFMDAVGLMYYYPAAHYYIGETLAEMQEYEKAIEAFEICLRLAPNINKARQRIIQIYETKLQQPGKALKFKKTFQDTLQGEITIVSGLPRSGTSMMMQMLDAAGCQIFTDKERTADENNPKGYYEHEAVKNSAKNKKWVSEANGKTVKVIAQLLEHLPMNFQYKVIFMERDVLEVVQSQQKMLVRNGKNIKEDTLPLNLVNSYNDTLSEVKLWAEKQPNVELLLVNHRDIIENPFMQAMLVNDFLEGNLKPELMAACVDAKLYREKIVNTASEAI